jgi:hypothetical protein
VLFAPALVVAAAVVGPAPLNAVHPGRRRALEPGRGRRDREQNQSQAERARHHVIRL